MKRVIDAHALMAFLEREAGSEKVKEIFLEAFKNSNNLLMSSVNFGEVYYIVLREYGNKKAQEIVRSIEELPIDIVSIDKEIAQIAGNIKAFKKMSYADSFAAALAKFYKASILTGDPEFKEVEKEITIEWI